MSITTLIVASAAVSVYYTVDVARHVGPEEYAF